MGYTVYQTSETTYVLKNERWYTYDFKTETLLREEVLDLFYMPSDEMVRIEPDITLKSNIDKATVKLILNV